MEKEENYQQVLVENASKDKHTGTQADDEFKFYDTSTHEGHLCQSGIYGYKRLTSWLVGLEFNSQVLKVMLSQSVYLNTLFLGRLSPLKG